MLQLPRLRSAHSGRMDDSAQLAESLACNLEHATNIVLRGDIASKQHNFCAMLLELASPSHLNAKWLRRVRIGTGSTLIIRCRAPHQNESGLVLASQMLCQDKADAAEPAR